MKVLIDEKALSYLEKKQVKEISIDLAACYSWVPRPPIPTVLLEGPQNVEAYEKHEIDGITVYILKGLKAKDNTARVRVQKVLIFDTLVVDDVWY